MSDISILQLCAITETPLPKPVRCWDVLTSVSALWYWGWTMNGTDPTKYVVPRAIIYVVWPLGVISLAFAGLMFWGLPEFYHQIPPYVPNFFKTLFRRKLVIWFFIAEILRDYWLSGP